MIVINNLEEMKKYYVEEINTYCFRENVRFTFSLDIEANIKAYDIVAYDIVAYDINAHNINAYDINACDIEYYGVCFAYNNIICNSIKSERLKHKHFVLDGELIIKGSEENADNNK